MRDVFPDDRLKSSAESPTPASDADASRIRDSIEGQVVCPFCGVISDGKQPICAKCTMENSAVARKATKLRIGPWYVLQNRNPAAPGMKWETLLQFVRKGRVKPQSIVRGPTTHQLWRFAAHVKGLSREFGVCYSCGGSIERDGNLCAHCNRLQEPPINPDTLLEGDEADPRLPIYKEVGAPEDGATTDNTPTPAALRAQAEELRLAREQEEARWKEQQDTIARERDRVEREKESAAREREALRREQDGINRERELVARERDMIAREKQTIEKDRVTLARERDLLRRERDTSSRTREPLSASVAPPEPASSAPEAVAKPELEDGSAWGLGEPESKPAEQTPPPDYRASERPAPVAAERPAASAPGPKAKLPSDGFLSAKDLAAAFKLNMGQEYEVPAQAPTLDTSPLVDTKLWLGEPPRRKRRILRKLFVLMLLAACAGASALWYQPQWRDKAMTLWTRITESTPPKPPPPKVTTPPSDDLPDVPPEIVKGAPDKHVFPATTQAATRPSWSDLVPAATGPSLEPTTGPAESTAPDPIETLMAKDLYQKAIQAEEREDFAAAAKFLDQIMKMPRKVWPRDDLEDKARVDRVRASQN